VPPEAIERREHDAFKPAAHYGVSPALSAVLNEALAVEPEKRLQTVQTLQDRLGVGTSSRIPQTPTDKASSRVLTEPGSDAKIALPHIHNTAIWVAAMGVLGTVLVVILGVGYWQWKASEFDRQRETAELAAQRLALESEVAALKRESEEGERQKAEQRLAELAAQQVIEQMRMQEQQRQREDAEKAALVAANAIREAQSAESRRQREEAERRVELQRQQEAERQSEVLMSVRSYFDHVNNRRADQAMRILEASSPKTRALIENTEWVRLEDLRLVDVGLNRAVVRVVFEGKARGELPERYQGTIPLRWTNDGWHIMTLTNLTKQ